MCEMGSGLSVCITNLYVSLRLSVCEKGDVKLGSENLRTGVGVEATLSFVWVSVE